MSFVQLCTGINEDIKFNDLPDDWKCPVCGADKENFLEV
jgi:rubredoxin